MFASYFLSFCLLSFEWYWYCFSMKHIFRKKCEMDKIIKIFFPFPFPTSLSSGMTSHCPHYGQTSSLGLLTCTKASLFSVLFPHSTYLCPIGDISSTPNILLVITITYEVQKKNIRKKGPSLIAQSPRKSPSTCKKTPKKQIHLV